MWIFNTVYFNLIFVHVTLAATLTINQSNRTIDNPVTTTAAAELAITSANAVNEERDIKIFKNAGIHSNVVGFHAFLESSLQRKVLEYTLNPLTNLGDNFGAVLQTLEVKFIDSNDSNQIETLHLVCKIRIPKEFNLIKNLHKNFTEFTKEIHFFSEIVPAIQHFEEDENVPQVERINNAFPRYFGSRLSLNSSATAADNNAALLLENLKFSNYVNRDRKSRLDRPETMATLKVLAKMHALGISMRRKQPEIFNSKIGPYLQTIRSTYFITFFKNITDELRSVFTNYSEKVLAAIEQQQNPGAAYLLKTDPDDHTPYTTIGHRDLWVTNVMFKNDKTEAGYTIQVKLLDFQKYHYESFANDLIYFLLISAPLDELKTNFKSFIEYYHLEFTKTLQYVDVSLDDYTYDKMWNEIKQTAKLQLIRVLSQIKIHSVSYDGSTSNQDSDRVEDYIEQPASDIVLNQWRCIIDLFIENEFI